MPGTARALSDAPLSAVRNLVVRSMGSVATVSWRAPARGSAARYRVQAFLGSAGGTLYGTRVVSRTSLAWDRLPFNTPVQFSVTPVGPDGPGNVSGPDGPVNQTGVVVPANRYCPVASGACVVVDSGLGQGAEEFAGAGLLHGTVPAHNPYASRLHLTHWRISSNNPIEFRNASAYVAPDSMIQVLSDGWYAATARRTLKGTYAADPWADWNRYTTFVRTTVAAAVARGQHPLWEIQNEPEGYRYSPNQPPSRYLVELEYLYAYRAIKSADPHARVVGPSIDWMYETSSVPWYIDMKTFIPFAAQHGMRLAALAWHDNLGSADSDPLTYDQTPEVVRDHAAVVRELIAENRGIGRPALFVDENSSGAGQFSPGWEAGYLAEEERAGLALGGRSCWNYPDDRDIVGDCFGSNLGQLLGKDGVPTSSFWTMADYTAMHGTRVGSATTDPDFSSLAVKDPSGVVRVLIGRHQTCSGWTAGASYCPVLVAPAAKRTVLNVLLPTGASTARVTVQALPDSTASFSRPPPAPASTVGVSDGLARVLIPSFQDGESYFVTVAPGSVAGPVGRNGDLARAQSPAPSGRPQPAHIIPESGSGQRAALLMAYPYPLVALVTDQYGSPLAGRQVTFRIPAGWGRFAGGGDTAVAVSDAYGVAASPSIKAGLATGSYSVAAILSAGRGLTAYFGLNSGL